VNSSRARDLAANTALTRTAVVTGAAGAIGTILCERLLDRGFHVIAVDRDAAGLAALPDPTARLQVDLGDDGFPDLVAEAVARRGNGLDMLVHNAGVVATGAVQDRQPAMSRLEQIINLQAPILLTERLFRELQSAGGVVVGVGSGGALFPMAASPGYSASKAGLRAYLLALNGSRKHTGVRTALVHPTAVDTPMLRLEAEQGGSLANFTSAPMSPEAVADAVVSVLDRHRLEIFLPWSSEFQLKLLNAFPQLLRLVDPVLDHLGARGLARYRASRGITG
jgi:short-subunit dehydrogenase